MSCESSIRWSGAAVHESGQVTFDRLSRFNCTENKVWSVWSDGEYLVQGSVSLEEAGEHQLVFSVQDLLGVDADDEALYGLWFKLLGPFLSFLLCCASFVYLYRRSTQKRFFMDHDIALAEHPRVPLSARIAVPIILYATVGLFAFSNASIGAKVTAGVEMFDHKLFETSLFDFSLVNTVTDMWKAGVYPLSILVCIWSGLWPYLKCLLMLAAWFVPPHSLSPAHRRRLLISLDILGKWALLDLFLMNMMSVAFRFHIIAATIKFLPKNFIAVDVKVTPQFGLFTFVTAVAFSLVANHVILVFHRNVVSTEEVDDGRRGSSFHSGSLSATPNARSRLLEESEAEDEDLIPPRYCINFPVNSWFDAGTKEAFEAKNKAAVRLATSPISLFGHPFSHGTVPEVLIDRDSRQLKLSLRMFLVMSWMLVFCLIIACGVEDTFNFVFSGLAGKLISLVDPEQQTRKASLLSIAQELGKGKEDGHVFEVLYLQSLYLLFAFIFPLVVLTLSLIMLAGRFTLRQAKMCFYTLEVVSAWAALDVFIVAIIASVLQINQFSHFLEGPMCDPIEKYLGVKECFGVETKLLKGCWLIVAASVTFWCFVQFVQRVAERAIADREERIIEMVVHV